MADALKFNKINEELQQKIKDDRENHWVNPYAFKDENATRRDNRVDKANLWRPVFVRDTEKIMHLSYYNRYADKTQVFSFKNNDDITRRAQHVQLVSRVARNIGSVLGLNLDLIEAIALGHDIGHTPFGHAGERFLSELYHNETGRYFNHNVHSTRVLDKIFARNFTMQTLDVYCVITVNLSSRNTDRIILKHLTNTITRLRLAIQKVLLRLKGSFRQPLRVVLFVYAI